MRLTLVIILALLISTSLAGAAAVVRVVTVREPITPVTARYLQRNLEEAARHAERLVLVELDTPGGLDTAMRAIVQDFLASPVPVAVYVAPAGARAASAGALLCLAADFCAMAPGTNLGAAHPVALGARSDPVMEAKAVNDAEAYAESLARQRGRNEALAKKMVRDSLSLSAEKAQENGVADLVVASRAELLRQLDGRSFRREGREATLHLGDAASVEAGMRRGERILAAISHPNVAYVLLMLGIVGIFFELASPGVILPGTLGGIALILAFFAFQALPVNFAGLLLILLSLVLFIAEIKIVSYGMLTVAGGIALILGSLILFEAQPPYLRLSLGVLLVTVLAVAAFFGLVVTKALNAQRRVPTTGREGLIGERGTAQSAIAPEGKVFVRGEYWDAQSDAAIAAGEAVVVTAVEGMRLKVRKIE